MKTFAFIFARGGSKGIPNKNLKKINNISLLEYSIKVAKKSKQIQEVFVSSDSNQIIKLANKLNAYTIQRPKHLAQDTSPEWLSWKHAINKIYKKNPFDIFISLPTTSPLRSTSDVNSVISKYKSKKPDILYTINESNRNPYFNMVVKNNNLISKVIQDKQFFRRQDAPKTYDLNTVAVVTTPEYINTSPNQFHGNVYGHLIPNSRSLDIDTYLDYKMAKLILEKNVRK